MRTYFKHGSWNAICDVCGFEYKADQLRKNWKGLYVCPRDWEARHPQDYIRARKERTTPPWVRPEGEDQFIFVCDLWSSSPMADFGEADCATVGGNTNIPFLIDLYRPIAIAGIAITGRSIPGVLS